MPVEIRELIIKMTVNKPLSSDRENTVLTQEQIRHLKREIIEECTEIAKDLIEKKKNR
ncbi:MAG: hypothetical protein ACI85O_002755 [Saprospiraceae bacterium]|jgi:hypothetical protein